jgi:hypothetical protein
VRAAQQIGAVQAARANDRLQMITRQYDDGSKFDPVLQLFLKPFFSFIKQRTSDWAATLYNIGVCATN